MNKKLIFGIVLLAGFSGLLLQSFGNQVGGYMDYAEAKSSGANAHIVGTWVKEKHFSYDAAANIFRFEMKDEKGNVFPVEYHDMKPPNFEDAEQVVVEGKMEGNAFKASHILVKCPSKYNDQMVKK
jgi:cytochrome c-type biogenesis protein CcmE